MTATGPAIGRTRRWGILVASVLVGLLVAACTASDPGDGSEGAGGPTSASTSTSLAPRDVRRPTIHLGVTGWTGARANAAIAERLIERRLGYPVEAVAVTDMASLFMDLETGELDAILELWPSSLEEGELDTIASGAVAELGPLGVEGRIGWWVPRYVAEGELGVTDWEALADPAVAAAFAGPGAGSTGQFLGTDPAYAQYDEALIEALDLPFEVTYSGSDDNTARAVDAAVTAGRPVLLYWWTPTALVARYDLVNVALPPRTDACVAAVEAGGEPACDYPVDVLMKLGYPELAAKAPEVDRFLRAFQITTEDQLAIIDGVENQGRSLDRVVDEWIAANQDRWETWLG